MTQSRLLRLMFMGSGTALCVLLMQTEHPQSFLITAAAAVVTMFCLLRYTDFLHAVLEKPGIPEALLSAAMTLHAAYCAKSTFFSTTAGWMWKLLGSVPYAARIIQLIPWAVMCAALPMLYVCMLWAVRFFRKLLIRFLKSMDYSEQIVLVGGGIVFGILIVMTYICSQAFYGAHVNGYWYNFDLVYSADSGYLVGMNVYGNVGAEQNDLRQALFGVFGLPFAELAFLLSRIIFMVPYGYVLILQIIQMMLYLIGLCLLSRMLRIEKMEKTAFLLLMMLSYPVLIFVLTAEQYLFALFYLMLFLYMHGKAEEDFGFVAASGTLVTSGILFPLATWDRRPMEFIRKTWKLFLKYLTVVILSGRLTTYLDLPYYLFRYREYTGEGVPLISRLLQYVNMIGACLVAPDSGIDWEMYRHVSWQMRTVTSWNWIGLVLLILAGIGIIRHRKKRFSRICAFWLVFSFLLLGIGGWGTVDNGLFLYSLYFNWAVLAMAFESLDVFRERLPYLRSILTLAVTVLVGFVNIQMLRELVIFATQYFPNLS